jgi:hypothetical protein
MIPGKLALENHIEGDGWDGVPAFLVRINDQVPGFPIEEVEMLFCRDDEITPNPAIILSSTNDKVTFDANTWEIFVPEQEMPLLVKGKWFFQFKIKPVGGLKKTYIEDVLTVTKTVRSP